MNSQLLMEQVREGEDDDGFYQKVEGIYGSFGSGLTFSAAFGMPFGKSSFGWDLENSVLLGKTYKNRSVSYDGIETKVRNEQHAFSYQITPSLTYNFPWKKLSPYLRVGPILGFTKIFSDVTIVNTSQPKVEYTFEYRGGMSLGIKTAIGASLELSRRTRFFWEISLNNMTYAPKEGWLTDFDVQEVSELDEFTNDERTIKFEKDYTLRADDDDEITVQTKRRHAMSALALNLGIIIKLGSVTP